MRRELAVVANVAFPARGVVADDPPHWPLTGRTRDAGKSN